MDRNSLIGLFIIGAILIGWLYLASPTQEEIAQREKYQDSLAQAQKAAIPNKTAYTPDSLVIQQGLSDSIAPALSDSLQEASKKNKYGVFVNASEGENEDIILENELIRVTLSTLGGRVSSVELKEYKTSGGKPLLLFDKDSSIHSLSFVAGANAFSTNSLYFTPQGKSFSVQKSDSGSVSLRLYAGDKNKYIEYVYGLRGNSYMLDYNMNIVGMQDVIAANSFYMTLDWQMKTPAQEKSKDNEKAASTIYFKYAKDEADKLSETSNESKSLETKTKWVAFKQQFFSSVLIADEAFDPSTISTADLPDSSKYVKNFTADLTIPYSHNANETFGMKFYFGPNHFQTLKAYDLELEKLIPLGWGIFGWVNRFLVIPIFNFLDSFNLNYGIIILILTLFIKLILFPIAFKTYLSSAKMRVLKPEVEEINKKFAKEDPLKKQQAMMALYRKAGVNPMAGCIPLLLQMPILIALFNFFPASIELRQQAFLWADDLSTYDSILDLSFNIPFYGDHVSLFTLLMTISTMLYTYTNSQLMSTGSEQMPGMKVMMYLMPVMFLGIFNNYSSGLSYYYFLANMITFGQTFLMQRFINEDELHRKIQEHKKKPVKASRFQQKLEQMAKQQQQRAKEARKR